VLFFLLLAWVQLDLAVKDKPDGDWFLFGRDTVSHDLPVQMWIAREVLTSGGEMPLWMPPLHGGLPTLGAWLWTPYAPSIWAFAVLPTPLAQRFQFLWALWWAGLGGYVLGRVMGMSRAAALLVGVGCGLSGHLVTLIHAGHLQKILALAWLPWLAAGGWGSGRREERCGLVDRLAWASLGGLSLGMMFLSGHPQIAYVGVHVLAVMALLGGGWDTVKMRAAMLAGMLMLGGLVASAQLLPGLEMGALSNRAAGVSFEESVATSYPPSELAEFALPRHRGDSSPAGFGRYVGAWGERLVSDYAGVLIILLASFALIKVRDRRSLVWSVLATVSLVVGLGANTPLYSLLHAWWPGMNSFRSPGTFFAGVALALPVLAGLGWEALLPRLQAGRGSLTLHATALVLIVGAVALLMAGSGMAGLLAASFARSTAMVLLACGLVLGALAIKRGRALAMAALLLLVASGDLLLANRAFLVAAEWAPYEAYLGPTDIDVALMDEPRPLRVFEPGRELSLQPLLNDRDALLGYHPVTYRAVNEQTDRLGFDSQQWRAAWGVQHRVIAQESELLSSESIVAPVRGGFLVRDATVRAPVRGAAGDELAAWEWMERSANRVRLIVTMNKAGTLLVKETAAPGWRVRVNNGAWESFNAVEPVRRVALPAGVSDIVMEYRPESHRLGLFLTMVGLMLIAAIATMRLRRM
jgi:hypothetical protein